MKNGVVAVGSASLVAWNIMPCYLQKNAGYVANIARKTHSFLALRKLIINAQLQL